MAGPYMVNSLILNITESEISTSNVIVNRSQQLAFNANVGEYQGYFNLTILGANPIALPAPIVYQVYIKNIDPANNFFVQYTPQGQPAISGVLLKPGDVAVPCWSAGGGLNGITALILFTSAANTLVEYFLGA